MGKRTIDLHWEVVAKLLPECQVVFWKVKPSNDRPLNPKMDCQGTVPALEKISSYLSFGLSAAQFKSPGQASLLQHM